MYIEYDDPQRAPADAKALVGAGSWRFQEDRFGRRHVYERLFVAGKDPTLRAAEIEAAFSVSSEAGSIRGSAHFFEIKAPIVSFDWTGLGHVLFHIEGDLAEVPRRAVVVTAFRVRNWAPTSGR